MLDANCNTRRLCSICMAQLDLSNFYDRKGGSDGKQRQCKQCLAARWKERRAIEAHIKAQQLERLQTKTCRNCKTEKQITEFGRYKQGGARYELICRVCNECKKNSIEKKKNNKPSASKRHDYKRILELKDSYIKRKISDTGIRYSSVTDALIEMKRTAIYVRRQARLLRSANDESSKDTDRITGNN